MIFSAFFALVAGLPLLSGKEARYWALAPAILVGIISATKPSALHRANEFWAHCGELLERIVNPVILAVLFYTVLVPFGIIVRMFRKDPLHLKFNPNTDSYWIRPEMGEVSEQSMINQF